MDVATWLLLVFGGLALCLAVWLFRHGSRHRFITRKPFLHLGFWTIGMQVLLSIGDWLIRGIGDVPLFFRAIFAVATFAIGASIWLTGFFYGRWRTSRSDGVISRNR